jgi:glycosyltransferase involved in cell wall biosynthesis
MPDQQEITVFVTATRQQETANLKAAVLPSARQETFPRITYRYLREWYQLVGRELFSEWRAHAKRRLLGRPEQEPIAKIVLPQWEPRQHELQLSGVVFTSLFNPYDGRKNWNDMLTAFCAAFRDCSDATLLFKLGSHDCQAAMSDMLMCMARLPAFSCRVVIVHGFLEGESFESLIEASHFIVNASHGEGQCLPLMEFLSCGRPAVAPRNSALLDYIDTEVGFVVEGWLEATAWSHDPRWAFRTFRQQINWESLVAAYRAAYHCVREEPQRYAELSRNAIERMRDHCSRQVARERLKAFLNI